MQKFCQNGGIADLQSVKKNEGGTVTVVINNTFPGDFHGGQAAEQIVHYKDGKIFRVEAIPVDADKFDSMIGRVMDLPKPTSSCGLQQVRTDGEDNVTKLFRAFIGAFDGSPDAFAKAKPIMDDLFDPDVFCHIDKDGTEGKDYNWFLSFVAKYAENRNVAKIEELERTQTGLRTVIHNTVKGEDMGSTEQRGVVTNGRIVYWEAVPNDEDEYQKMIDRVTSSSSPDTKDPDNVTHLFRALIAAFDGSPDALAKAKPIMDDLYDPNDLSIRLDKDDTEYKDYEWYLELLTSYSEDRNIARIEELERTDNGLRVIIHNTVKGEDMGCTEQRGIVKNGRIVYWEAVPSDEEEFKNMIDRVMSSSSSHNTEDSGEDTVTNLFRALIASLDGSADAFAKAKPIIEELYDPNLFSIRLDKEDAEAKDYEWFLRLLANYAEDRNVARMEEMERTGTGLRTVIHNTVKGEDMGSTEQRGIVQNGRIVYWEAAPGDEEEFKKMIDRVML